MSTTPAQRSLQAKLAAHVMHSRNDSRETTARARDAFNRKFEDQVDPQRTLTETERARRVAQARSAYFTRLALASSKARTKGTQ